ncbi:MAG: crotonase/enoyl-CoA hydratase family protein [Actinobacteria bacterium]|nr:crotonase/enoyl-CoA hydratase family protein [Actinomycetota bacterium]
MAPVVIECRDRVTTITINRPDVRNAIDATTAAQLHRAFDEFDRDDGSDVAVLTGAGGHFCAGADLKAIASGAPNRLSPDGPGPLGPTRMELRKPVIAAIAGYAVAGGLELALWCDLRVVEETATMGVFCRRWGVPLIDGGTVRLADIVGLGVALDLVLTGRPVDAAEAARIGLASRVVPEGAAVAEAQQLAREIAKWPQECLRSDRMSLLGGRRLPLAAALANEFEHGMATIGATGLAGVRGFKGVS